MSMTAPPAAPAPAAPPQPSPANMPVAPVPAVNNLAGQRGGRLNVLLVVVVVGALWWSAAGTGLSLTAPFSPENTRSVVRFVSGAFPPNLEREFVSTVGRLVVETIQISIAGTALAIVLAFPLSVLAMHRAGEEYGRAAAGRLGWTLRWLAYSGSRSILNVLRAVPELVWALIFVVAVGLGPYPGVLALAAHSTGILGKLYAELFESVDSRLVEAGRVTGASELAVLLFVRVPVTLPVLLSYTLFRWECNMRAATVLGFVGAGGLGTQLAISMKLFEYGKVLTLVAVLLALVVMVDVIGHLIRSRMLAPTGAVAVIDQEGAESALCRPCEVPDAAR